MTSLRVMHVTATAVALLGLASTPRASASQPQAPPELLAIVDVNVVPMHRPGILARQTVIVRDGRIAAIGPSASTAVPVGARRVDGAGKFLIPGLHDMHVHVAPYAGEGESSVRRTLALLVANGVTTVRSMVGHPTHLRLRHLDSIGVPTPHLVLAAPQITGPLARGSFAQYAVPDGAAAAERVALYAREGWDLIKVTFALTPEVHDSITAAARRANIRVAGHVVPAVGLFRALAAGQQIEHLDAYMEAVVAASAAGLDGDAQGEPGTMLVAADSAKLSQVARATRDAGVYNTPTLALFERAFVSSTPAESLLTQPGVEFFSAKAITAMTTGRRHLQDALPGPADREHLRAFRTAMTRALHEVGAPLMAGSDSPQQFMIAGFALHDELAALQAAGLPPSAVLAAATRTPAEYLGRSEESGTIEVGKAADLVLLAADPLADVRNARRIEGVVLNGRWLSRADLDALMESVRPSMESPR